MEQNYKTVRDALKILLLFNDLQADDKSVTEISRVLEMPVSKVSRVLKALEDEAFLERNSERGKYRLGSIFFELGMIYAYHLPMRKIIRPHIEEMAKELKMTASWGILRNSKTIVMDRVQNLNIDMLTHRIGLNLPIYTTSLGKMLLAYLPESEQDRILKSVNLKKFTNATIVDRKLIKENLRLARERGYATDECETHEDLNCIAVPIRNGTGDVIAAINLTDEKSKTDIEKLCRLCDYLKEKALFISRQLGYRSNIL